MELNKLPGDQFGNKNPLVVEQSQESCGMDDDLKVKVPAPVSMHGPELLYLIRKTAPKNMSKQVMAGNTWAEKDGVSLRNGGVVGTATVLPHVAILTGYLVVIAFLITLVVHEGNLDSSKSTLEAFVNMWTSNTDFNLLSVNFAAASFLLSFYLNVCHNTFVQTQSQVRAIQGKLQNCWLLFPLHSQAQEKSAKTNALSSWTYNEHLSRISRYAICSVWLVFQEYDTSLRPGAMCVLNQLLTEQERMALVDNNTGTDMLKVAKFQTLLYWMETNYLRALGDSGKISNGCNHLSAIESIQRLRTAYASLQDSGDDNGGIPYAYVNFIYLICLCFLLQAALVLPTQQEYCTLISAFFVGILFAGLLELGKRLVIPFDRYKLYVLNIYCGEMQPLVDLSVVIKEIHTGIEFYTKPAPN